VNIKGDNTMKLIQLYGGPGTGKSTIAAGLFYKLKTDGVNAELLQEYVKQWAWEERKPVSFDQFYFFGKQARKEYTLIGKVETAVTDSPIVLCGYYAKLFGSKRQSELFDKMVLEYIAMRKEKGVEDVHIFLRRIKPYNPKGRFQSADEAKKIDGDMLGYLASLGLAHTIANADLEEVYDVITT
jgi:nicotinamide riboside kinase